MTPDERDPTLLEYIQESINLIAQYTGGDRARFPGDRMVQDAVLRRLETLAEAASRLSEELKARHPEMRWRAVRGFRNVAAHDYQSVDLNRVWDVVESHLPGLRAVVDAEMHRG